MRERHHEVTRLEGFSDAVFGFALTLLVVSLETPQTVGALRDLMRGFLPFALTFAMVCWIWYEHNVFFRRYGLQDPWTAFLNSVLLFVVLFYVYPLKFMFDSMFAQFTADPALTQMTLPQLSRASAIYGLGFFVLFLIFTLLYRHAYRRRDELKLTPAEAFDVNAFALHHLSSAGVGLASMTFALLAPARVAFVAPMLFGLMGPLHWWLGNHNERKRRVVLAPER